ncbi:GHKL domain-containing protein [Butyricicoccus sp. OM06-6AC]|nr:GHKL domain-containing protein [Butyricicoccus sp. OM06-6AC]
MCAKRKAVHHCPAQPAGKHGFTGRGQCRRSADQAIGDTLLTTKADAASHGYGVKSMKQAAEQAHGMLTWRYEQRIFTLSVLLQDISEN